MAYKSKFGFRTVADDTERLDNTRSLLQDVVDDIGSLANEILHDHAKARKDQSKEPFIAEFLDRERAHAEPTVLHVWRSHLMNIFLYADSLGRVAFKIEERMLYGKQSNMHGVEHAITDRMRKNGWKCASSPINLGVLLELEKSEKLDLCFERV